MAQRVCTYHVFERLQVQIPEDSGANVASGAGEESRGEERARGSGRGTGAQSRSRRWSGSNNRIHYANLFFKFYFIFIILKYLKFIILK